jgi:hypothetical protein
MGKKYIVSENQFSMLMKKLTEDVAGYDDFFTMSRHAGMSMGNLISLLNDLMMILSEIKMYLHTEDVSYREIENLTSEGDLKIDEIKRLMMLIFKDFTEKETIRKGKILVKKLTGFQKMIKMLNHYGPQVFDGESGVKEKLENSLKSLGTSLLDYAKELRTSHENISGTLQRHKPKYED